MLSYTKTTNKHFFVSFSCRKLVLFLSLFLFLISLGSCKKSEKVESSAPDNLKITATFYPLYIMLLNITDGIEGIDLNMLAPANTGCLHDYQLTTKDMSSISDCDILVMNGAGMEDFIDKVLELKKDSTIIAAEGFQLTDDNAHIWVSPTGAIHEVRNIADGLKKLNPENAELYEENATLYIQKLEYLKLTMHNKLDKFQGEVIIPFHEAFPYFAEEFGFVIGAIVEREPGSEPSPKELMDVISLIKETENNGKQPALFAEKQYSSTAAEVIAKETGLIVRELDPAVSGELVKDAYISAMIKNMNVLEVAF